MKCFKALQYFLPFYPLLMGTPSYSEDHLLTQEILDQWRDELIPIVETEAEGKFITQPKVRLASIAEINEVAVRDRVEIFFHEHPETPREFEPQLALAFRNELAALSANYLGKFDYRKNEVLVASEVLSPEDVTRPEALRESTILAKSVVGHEILHDLQNQLVPGLFRALLVTPHADAKEAIDSIIEGHAVLVQKAIAERLGFDSAAFKAANVTIRESPEGGKITVEEMAKSRSEAMIGGKYKASRKFMEYWAELKGKKYLWEILKNPPTSTAMIYHPQTYDPAIAPRVTSLELLPTLQDLATSDPGGNWLLARVDHLGEHSKRTVLANFPEEMVERLMRDFYAARSTLFVNPENGLQPNLVHSEFNNAKSASEHLELLLEHMRNTSNQVHDHDIRISGIRGLDPSKSNMFSMAPAQTPSQAILHVARAVAGPHLFEFTIPGALPNPHDVARCVLSRLIEMSTAH